MTVEQLLLLLFLLLVPLFQFIVPVLRKRMEELVRQASESEAGPISSEVSTASAPHVEIREKTRRTPLPTVAPPTARRRARSPVRSLRSVRRGIVLMTILGPCRAFDSPEPRRSEGVP